MTKFEQFIRKRMASRNETWKDVENYFASEWIEAVEEFLTKPEDKFKPGDRVIWDDGNNYRIGNYVSAGIIPELCIIEFYERLGKVPHSVPRIQIHKFTEEAWQAVVRTHKSRQIALNSYLTIKRNPDLNKIN